ncbi:valacyclovir hydrolase [Phlyctema vagabunda]|uniref:Valacyclovir hydrolase n=1 Tax=Phlyctema vagabunda TaxID=108571 RepID=A0ABR4PML6_9HELO
MAIPTLPPPVVVNGLNHLPGPSAAAFDAEFAGILPPGDTIPSSWGSTRYYDFSPGPTATGQRRIILIHGAGTPAIGLAPLAYSLKAAGSNHVVIYDIWGHGCSSTPLATHTPALYHTQLLELLARLQWTRVHLVGYSFGGVIATTFTARHSATVASLSIAAAPGLWQRAERSFVQAIVEEGGWGLEWLSQRRILSRLGMGDGPREGWQQRWRDQSIMDTNAVEQWERAQHPGHVATLVSSLRHGGVYDAHAAFRAVADSDVPTLAFYGERDGVVLATRSQADLRALGWRGEVVVFPGAGHPVVRERVPEMTELLGKFWHDLE